MTADDPDPRRRYVAEVLRRYATTPTVLGRIRHADRALAASLFDQGIPLYALADALLVGAARRVLNDGFSTAPLPPIRSLHYFIPVLREILDRPPGYRELEILQDKLAERLAQ